MLKSEMSRFGATLGFLITLCGALLVGAPVATAASTGAAAQDRPSGIIDASTVGQQGVADALRSQAPAAAPYYRVIRGAARASCPDFHVCFWSGDNFSGTLYAFGGNYAPCEGWRFEGTVIQDHAWSFWNRASGPVSVWTRYPDGSYRYIKIGHYPRGYVDGSRFSNRADAWVYDPNNNCSRLNLHPA